MFNHHTFFNIRLLIVIACTFMFFSCSKIATTSKLVNSWTVQTYYKDGADETASFNTSLPNYRLDVKNDFTFYEFATPLGISIGNSGTWLQNDVTHVTLTDAGNGDRYFTINESRKNLLDVTLNNERWILSGNE